ncbi:MAG: bifunctional 5,10-methylenetetrahydrofolate dehydrogenase/5,10-methenyltetrahydrofolate cyclohydrolase [bacterium]|nr:bifunctional 5,10-methylenetetrahydrofolate dehydrogenase/5,10-methenyltetrahydrofolate cyclohydrolase [bacterium]MDZ4284934.1 bifunctional 5,10-methylenetetrahydrofolate dehydrogenase/5,10-methenyltetrahydrofolate cyclohydrolase [Patescibacteria group bacterium]
MLVEGKKIADDIRCELAERIVALGRQLILAVIQVGSERATEKFIERKKKFGEAVGVAVVVYQFPSDVAEDALAAEVRAIGEDPAVGGLIVQLPLPIEINGGAVLECIPPEKDVDALSSTSRVLAPVAGAVAEIFTRYSIDPRGKKAVVVGEGRLVGKPVADWLRRAGALVETVSLEMTREMRSSTQRADIIVSGAGVPRLITPEFIKDDVVLIDAGTSESDGVLVGDIDPACAEKAALYTSVPGGVGPVTVAKLFENLVILAGG